MTLVWAFIAWVVFLLVFAWLHRRMVRRGEAEPIAPVKWVLFVGVSALVWSVPLFYVWGR